MRVLLIVSRFGRGGTESQVPLIVQSLAEDGVDARALTLFKLQPIRDDIRLDDQRVVSLDLDNLLPLNLLRATAAVRRYVRQNNIEVVHGFLTEGNIVACLAAALARIPAITSHRDLGIDSPRLLKLNSWGDRFLASAVTANCRAAAEAAAARAGIAAADIAIVPNILAFPQPTKSRAETRMELGLTSEHQVLISVGHLRPVKGQDVLIDAMKLVVSDYRRSEARLLIAGEETAPGYERTLRDNVSAAGLSEQVKFLGARNDISNLMNAADLFVLPSRSEALSNAILEAFAAGTPVITTAVGGSVELMEGGAGLLVPPGEPQPMAEAIVSLLADPDRRYQLVARGRTAASAFTPAAALAALKPLYESALRK